MRSVEAARPGAIFLFLDVEDTLWAEIAALAASSGRRWVPSLADWCKQLSFQVHDAAAAVSER